MASIRPLTWRALAIGCVLTVAAFAVWMQVQVGGAGVSSALDDVGEGVVALLAAGACADAARRAQGRRRAGWIWVGASALSWAVGETLWCWFTYADGNTNPFPSLADVGFLGAVPTVVIGVWLLGFDRGQWWTGIRDGLDGLVMAGSLMFVSWMTALGAAFHGSGEGSLAWVLSLTYPISDVVVATVVLATLARAQGHRRRQLALLAAGLLSMAVSDSGFAYLSAVNGSADVLDTGWIAGYLLMALAALLPENPRPGRFSEMTVGATAQMVLPYSVLGIAGVAAVVRIAGGGQFDAVLFALGVGTTVLVMVRQLLTMVENGRLTDRLEATVTELRDRETELAHQAFHDSLTGLANRALFGDRLDHALARRARAGRRLTAVMVCDLDDFKVVNDTLGHEPGDVLLRAMAERLRASARAEDTVARLGGDEFAVLLEDLRTAEEVHQVARRMTRALAEPVVVGLQSMTATVSIGIAFAGRGDESSQTLLRDADIAMYEAKAAGGNCHRVFQPHMLDDVVARLDLKRDLRALSSAPDQLELHYQPIVDLGSAQVAGVEALMRWRHPERGLLLPGAFIETAETTGLIVPLGLAALRAACRQAAEWHAAGVGCPSVAVNLSARQLEDPDIVRSVRGALDEHGLAPDALTLEITESMTLNGAQSSIERLQHLKAIGVRLAIDDFGSGYSSLEYLRQLPVDALKIDRAFTVHVAENAGAAVLLDAMVRLAHTLGLVTVVEGIETAAQLDTVRSIGADQAQGFFVAEPVPAAAVTEDLALRRIGAAPGPARELGAWTAPLP
ncbi:MAG TPA: EAL domain-containing protein [Acidimicrobiales bacterium]|nr:EAL domain-containing protein [Acidimicrobiales bacterium]